MKYILFTGGGSAGHVVPNLALMRELRYTAKLGYMGTDGIERGLVTEAGYPFFEVNTPKLVRSLSLSNLSIPLRLHKAKKEALAVLERERPDLVFSKGGFASYPAVWAAHRLHIPVLTHESDLSPGLCTKLIAKKCAFVLTSFPETAQRFRNGRCVGSPIRKELLCGDRERARRKFGFSQRDRVLLVLGGGSGSRAINEAVRKHLAELLSRYKILHLCGKGNLLADPPEGTSNGSSRGTWAAPMPARTPSSAARGATPSSSCSSSKSPPCSSPLRAVRGGTKQKTPAIFPKRGSAAYFPRRSSEVSPLRLKPSFRILPCAKRSKIPR